MRILTLCDWLPPDFGAVGQYALRFAHELAAEGHQVTLVGFSSTAASTERQAIGQGELTVRRIHRPTYDRSNWLRRAAWTLGANLALLWGARRELRQATEVRFTGSPPYLIHFVMPLAKLLGLESRYRITDFHPECLMAALNRVPWWLRSIHALTIFWRRRVDVIEVLGEDQYRRIQACGVEARRIDLRRDPSPVDFADDVLPAQPPARLRSRRVILYSGNWGVAHDHRTFVEGFARFCDNRPDAAGLWLNATGKRADVVEQELARRNLPYVRTSPVTLDELGAVLLAADVHLITLDDRYVGFVLPSKVYACVASGRPVLFVGSAESDVHLVCSRGLAEHRYRRVEVGDAHGVCAALDALIAPGEMHRREPGSNIEMGSTTS